MKSLVQADIDCKANSEPRVNTPFSAYLLKFEQKVRLFFYEIWHFDGA